MLVHSDSFKGTKIPCGNGCSSCKESITDNCIIITDSCSVLVNNMVEIPIVECLPAYIPTENCNQVKFLSEFVQNICYEVANLKLTIEALQNYFNPSCNIVVGGMTIN